MYTIDFNQLDKKIENGYDFNFGSYLSKGFDLFKKDIGGFILAFVGLIIMSVIPLCQYIGLGNFYKVCEKIDKGEKTSFSDMFNFDKAGTYIILYLVILGCILLFFLPFILVLFTQMPKMENDPSQTLPISFFLAYAVTILGILLFSVAIFFTSPIIAFSNETSIGKIISYSWNLAKKNFFMIILFIFVAGLIGSLGVILCYIGLIATMPIVYCMYYECYKDVLFINDDNEINQISGI